jgi:hypothetical protein
MDASRDFLEDLKRHGLQRGHTLGLFQVLVGRGIKTAEGVGISKGLTWRELATLLKKARWPKDAVRDLGLDSAKLPPRDRYQFWYTAIHLAMLDSAEARQAGDAFQLLLEPLGYRVA